MVGIGIGAVTGLPIVCRTRRRDLDDCRVMNGKDSHASDSNDSGYVEPEQERG